MGDLKHTFQKKFNSQILTFNDLQKKKSQKVLRKIWKDAEKKTKTQSRLIKTFNKDGNGIW